MVARTLARSPRRTTAAPARDGTAAPPVRRLASPRPPPPEPIPSFSSRVRRGELLKADCPSREALRHITSRWGVLLLVVLMDGTHRFSELRRRIDGVSEKMLAQTLKGLEADGFVRRRALEMVPPHVEYTLTRLGREAGVRVTALADWIERSTPKLMKARETVAAAAAQASAAAATRHRLR